MTVSEFASWLNGEVHGNGEATIARVAKIEEAGGQDLTFLANPKYARFVATTRAGAILVGRSFDVSSSGAPKDLTFIKVDDPYVAFLTVLKRITPQNIMGQGIANPVGTFWSCVMLLEHLGEADAAAELMAAIETVTGNPALHTRDLGGTATTAQVTAAVCAAMGAPRAAAPQAA